MCNVVWYLCRCFMTTELVRCVQQEELARTLRVLDVDG